MTATGAILTELVNNVRPSSSWGTGAATSVYPAPSWNTMLFASVAVQLSPSNLEIRSDRTPHDNSLVDSLVEELFANDELLGDDVAADVDTVWHSLQ